MSDSRAGKIRVFTWHIHGSYLYYLSQGNYDIYIPVDKKKGDGYIGYGTTFPFASNVHEIPAEAVKELSFDCILFQTFKNYRVDQFDVLSEAQRALPKVYLEHDPPQGHPTDTVHVVQDPAVTIVHVTNFNKLMWNSNDVPAIVIDHGITEPTELYTGELERGIVVINNLNERGRRLGIDVFLEARKHVPLDLIGMNTQELGGLGEILHPQLPAFLKQYRFFFNPIRYTSLGLAVLEAMMIGLPIVGMATTEMVTVIENDISGYVHTDPAYLVKRMKRLLEDKALATRLGQQGRSVALERFNIERFVSDWKNLFEIVIAKEGEVRSFRETSQIFSNV
jgi:glycosyltransferase involved in cell wall biosynthesis